MSEGMSMIPRVRIWPKNNRKMTEKPGRKSRRTRWNSRFDEICHGFPVIGLYYIMYTTPLSRLGRVLITWMGNGHVIRNSDSKICERKAYWKGCYPMLRCYSNELSNRAPAVPTSDYRYWLAVPLIVLIHIAFSNVYKNIYTTYIS